MVEFDKVLRGIEKYISNEMCKGLNGWQLFLAEVAVERITGKRENLKEYLKNNTIVQMLDIMDDEGNVDVEGLLTDIKHKIEEKGKLCFTLPIFGKYTFHPSDVAVLHKYIMNA